MIRLTLLAFLLVSCGGAIDQNANEIKVASVIVGELDWKEITSLKSDNPMRAAASAVADVNLPFLGSRCTGFLISEDILMTNEHCVPSANHSRGLTATFKREAGVSESAKKLSEFDCSEFIGNNRELDFALLRCIGNPGATYGFVTLSEGPAVRNQKIYIVQQNCDYYTTRNCDWTKKYAQGSLTRIEDASVVHNVDTLGGSSGSPIFDQNTHQVIALHHAGLGNNGSGRGIENYGVSMKEILEAILSDFPEVDLGGDDQSLPPQHLSIDLALAITTSVFEQSFKLVNRGDSHFYKFQVNERLQVSMTISFQHRVGDLDLYLYDSRGSLVARSEGVSNSETIRRFLSQGEYVVVVKGYRQATGDYNFNLRAQK